MKAARLLTTLTVVNLAILVFLVTRAGAVEATGAVPVLRGRALEIVDEQGRVRASIKVQPEDRAAATPYPDTVILRLIDPNGRPSVKLATSERGAGLGLGGASDPTYVQLLAQGTETLLRLTNQDGRQQVVKP